MKLKFWEKTKDLTALEAPHTNYQVLTKEEFLSAKDVVLVEITHEDRIITAKSVTTNGGIKEQVLRLPLFVVGKSRDLALIESRMRLEIGEENYEEYYKAVNKVAELENKIAAFDNDNNSKDDMYKDAMKRLAYVKNHMGVNAYLNLMNNYDAAEKIKK